MKNFVLLILIFISYEGTSQQLINVNPDMLGDPWIVGGFRELTDEEQERITELKLAPMLQREALPSKINNTIEPYFRGVVMQEGGSCSQATGVAYLYTYEINLMRGVHSIDSANLYPSHYTYNFLNDGDDSKGSNYTDGWQIIRENGCPSFDEYGGLYPMGDKGWMNGYNKYYKGMSNRVADYYRIKIGTPDGLETLKRWFYDHGNGTKPGGLAVFSAGASPVAVRRVALGEYGERKAVAVSFSDPVNHAMTFVGYDDSIGYDFNNDGKITNDIDINNDSILDMRDWERGALLMVNTWGYGWGDSGFVYVPYRLLALKVKEGGISSSQAYVVIPEPAGKPMMTLKLRLEHNKRSQLSIRVGVAEYINASKHDYQMSFMAFNKKGGAFPMQGNNEDPIEIGLDVSPLLTQKLTEPVVFFLNITEEDGDTTGFGKILGWSLIDHTDGDKEYVSTDTGLEINNNGLTISRIVIIRGHYPPENLQANQNMQAVTLIWQKPRDVNTPDKYIIYKDDKEFGNVTDTFLLLPWVANGSIFKVRAMYGTTLSPPSNTIMVSNDLHLPVAGSGSSVHFDGVDDCIDCGNGVDLANHDFTIEFWAKRNADAENRFVIGHGKFNSGSKGLHIGFRNNKFYVGFWGDDISSDKQYTDPDWHHYAISFDTVTKLQKIYRDGEFLKKREAEGNYRGSGNLYIGCMSTTNWIFEGELDEVRIWDHVRTDSTIAAQRFLPLKGDESGLLGYWNFDEKSGDSIMDRSAANHTGRLEHFDELCWRNSLAWSARQMDDLTDSLLIFPGYSKYGHAVEVSVTNPPLYGQAVYDSLQGYFVYTSSGTYNQKDSFYYTVADDTLLSEYKIVVSLPVMSEVAKADFQRELRIYPNPFNERIMVELDRQGSGAGEMVLFDLYGKQQIRQEFIEGDVQRLETAGLKAGVYILLIRSGSLRKAYRLIKF